MEMEVIQKDGVLLVKPLANSIDAAGSKEFRGKIIDLINQGNKMLILNLSHIEFMDSNGLGSMISILKLLSNNEGNIVLCETQEPVQRLFTLTRLNQVFQMYQNENEALNSLKENLTTRVKGNE